MLYYHFGVFFLKYLYHSKLSTRNSLQRGQYDPTTIEMTKNIYYVIIEKHPRMLGRFAESSIYVILLLLTVGMAPTKHGVISMLPKQYTHIEKISLQKSYPVVFIMPRYIDQIKTFSQNLCCRGVKIDITFGVIYRNLLSNSKTFRNDFDNKRRVLMKRIS